MIIKRYVDLTAQLEEAGKWVGLLTIRLLLAYEFWTAGYGKLKAGLEAPSWFASQDFVFPFGLLSANTNWFMVTWGELLAAIAVALGLFTRFFAFALLIITAVAIAAVHWPSSWDSLGQLWEGYSVSRVMDDGEFRGNFRIPVLFLAMIMPLIFFGGGKLSLDNLLAKFVAADQVGPNHRNRLAIFGLAAVVFGVVFVYLIPLWGLALFAVGGSAMVYVWHLAKKGRWGESTAATNG
jgi:putative oxidoreductase